MFTSEVGPSIAAAVWTRGRPCDFPTSSSPSMSAAGLDARVSLLSPSRRRPVTVEPTASGEGDPGQVTRIAEEFIRLREAGARISVAGFCGWCRHLPPSGRLRLATSYGPTCSRGTSGLRVGAGLPCWGAAAESPGSGDPPVAFSPFSYRTTVSVACLATRRTTTDPHRAPRWLTPVRRPGFARSSHAFDATWTESRAGLEPTNSNPV